MPQHLVEEFGERMGNRGSNSRRGAGGHLASVAPGYDGIVRASGTSMQIKMGIYDVNRAPGNDRSAGARAGSRLSIKRDVGPCSELSGSQCLGRCLQPLLLRVSGLAS